MTKIISAAVAKKKRHTERMFRIICVMPCLTHVLNNQAFERKRCSLVFECYLISLSSLRYDWTFKMLGVFCHHTFSQSFSFFFSLGFLKLKTYLAFVCDAISFLIAKTIVGFRIPNINVKIENWQSNGKPKQTSLSSDCRINFYDC